MPHRVSNDSAEDNPAGHADGNSAGSGQKESCEERGKDNEHREGREGGDKVMNGMGEGWERIFKK